MLFTKHAENRMLERFILDQTGRKFSKKKREKYRSKIIKKYNEDMSNIVLVEYYGKSTKHVYCGTDNGNIIKYIKGEKGRILTVVKPDENEMFKINVNKKQELCAEEINIIDLPQMENIEKLDYLFL